MLTNFAATASAWAPCSVEQQHTSCWAHSRGTGVQLPQNTPLCFGLERCLLIRNRKWRFSFEKAELDFENK